MTFDPWVAVGVGAAVALLLGVLEHPEMPRLARATASWHSRARERGVACRPLPLATLWCLGWGVVATVVAVGQGGPSGLGIGLVASLLAAILGPLLLERIWSRRHERALSADLPTLLRQWAMALDGGMAPAPALREAARDADGPAALEARRVAILHALRSGRLSECWSLRASVLGSSSLSELAGVVAAVDRSGAPLARLLTLLARDLDDRTTHRDRMLALARGPLRQLAASYVMIAILVVGLTEVPALMGVVSPEGAGLAPEHWLALTLSLVVSVVVAATALRHTRHLGVS